MLRLYIYSVKAIYFLFISITNDGQAYETVPETCTYFGYCLTPTRVPQPQSGLGNCSWYAPNACCKRTEVTSIFSDMLPLYQATKECSNHMNYLMCYFCSPLQQLWYKKKASICSEFCDDVYKHCQSASYDGTAIGDAYKNGKEFCRAQNFDVKEGTSKCFAYDPTAFSGGLLLQHPMEVLALCVTFSFLLTVTLH